MGYCTIARLFADDFNTFVLVIAVFNNFYPRQPINICNVPIRNTIILILFSSTKQQSHKKEQKFSKNYRKKGDNNIEERRETSEDKT